MSMADTTLSYADILTKEVVHNWGEETGLFAEEAIAIHLEEAFRVRRISVKAARVEQGVLVLHIATDKWSVPREFLLTPEGSMMW